MASARKRRGKKDDLTVVLHVRVSKKAEKLLADRATSSAVTSATYHRQVLYRDLGLIDPKE